MKEYQDNDGALQLNPYRIYVLMRDALEPIRPLLQSMQQDMELLRDGLFTIVLIELKELKNDRPHVFNTLYNRLIDRDVIVGAYNSNVLETYHIRDVNDREDVKNLFCNIISEREELNKVAYLRESKALWKCSDKRESMRLSLESLGNKMESVLLDIIINDKERRKFISSVLNLIKKNLIANAVCLIDDKFGNSFWKAINSEADGKESDKSLQTFFSTNGMSRMPHISLKTSNRHGKVHNKYSIFVEGLSANLNFDPHVELRFQLASSFVLYAWALMHPELDVIYDHFDGDNEENRRELYAIILVLSGLRLRNNLETKSADDTYLSILGKQQYRQARRNINAYIKSSIQNARCTSFVYYEEYADDQYVIDSVAEIFCLQKEGEKKPQYLMLPKESIHLDKEFLDYVEFCKDNLVLQSDGMYRFAQNQNYTSLKRAIKKDIEKRRFVFYETMAWAEFYKNADHTRLFAIRDFSHHKNPMPWRDETPMPATDASIEEIADYIYEIVEGTRTHE